MMNICFEPYPNLETDRLILRPVAEKDLEDLYQVLSDPDVAKFDYFYPLTDREQVKEVIKRYQKQVEDNVEITWGLALKENNKLMGICCLGNIERESKRAEIGYDIAQAYWNKGYATEALKAMVDYGFSVMNLNRIEATITPGNDASIKVLKKLNFVEEGVLRERDLIKGKLEDGVMMSLLKREYLNSYNG